MTDGSELADKNSPVLIGEAAPESWRFKIALVAGAVLMAALTVAPFFVRIEHRASGRKLSLGLQSTHDLTAHLGAMEQFDKSLRSGVLYPRWQPDINGGYGNAFTNFYPPIGYYITSIIHTVVDDWVATLAVVCVIAMAASALTFYFLSRAVYGKAASLIGAFFYMVLPYHVLDLYWRGALAELLGLVFLPLLIYFALRVGEKGRPVDYAGLGLTYGLLVMTHLPVGYLMSFTLVVYAIAWSLMERNKTILLRIAGGMSLGLLVSAIYLLPAVVEAKYAHEENSGIFPYDTGYLPSLPAGNDIFRDTLNHSFMLQAIALAVALIVVRSMWRARNNSKPVPLSPTRLWATMGVSATFMVTALSFYVSKLIPRTELVQFPWRWLAIAGLFTSLLLAAAIDSLSGDSAMRRRRSIYRSAILVVVCLNVWLTVQRVIVGAQGNTSVPTTSQLVDPNYTPRGSTLPRQLNDTPRAMIDPKDGVVEILRWDPQHREVGVRVYEPTRIRLKTYNFPGWTARIDGKPVPMLSDMDGVQIVDVSAGAHTIEASFVNTPPRTAGALLSALALLAVIGLAILDRVRNTRRVTAGPTSRKLATVRSLKPLAVMASVLLIGAVILFWLTLRGRSGSSPASGGGPSATTGGITSVGSEGTLHIDNATSMFVGVDERALGPLVNALASKDNSMLDAIVDSGEVLRVANDTRVRILVLRAGTTKVRILQGEHVMAEGWVAERWIK